MPRDGEPDQRRGAAFDVIDPLSWAGRTPPPRDWIVDHLIPRGAVTTISGDGGIGKSLITIQLLVAAATGAPWLGMDVMRCRAMGVYCEDEGDELWRRTADITTALGVTMSELEDLTFTSRVGRDNLLMKAEDKYGRAFRETPLFGSILNHCLSHGVQLLVLDSLHDLFGGNENSRPEARHFINLLRHIALEIDGAVVLCAHPSVAGLASGEGTSGSTAWNNAVRSRLYLTRPKADERDRPDPDVRILSSKKSNYGGLGFELPLRWKDGIFIPDRKDSFLNRMEKSALEKVLIEAVREAWGRDMPLSSSRNADRYVPKFLARKSPKLKIGEIEKAMHSLIDAGAITMDQRNSRTPRGLRVTADAPPGGAE